jgi:hypothetical protein
MSDLPTSPTLDTNSDLMNDAKTFSGNMTLDLTDAEIQASWRIIQRIRKKHQEIFRRKFNDPSSFTMNAIEKALDEFEDEVKTELAEKVGVLASVNVVPILEGQPLQIEWLGVLPGHSLGSYGLDHERKGWEVKRATDKGENFLGEHDG